MTVPSSTVLLTMYDSRTRLADQVAADVRSHFGPLVIASVIPRNVRVSEAPGFGQTVMTYDAGSRGAVGYLEAARELAERGRDGSQSGAHPGGHLHGEPGTQPSQQSGDERSKQSGEEPRKQSGGESRKQSGETRRSAEEAS